VRTRRLHVDDPGGVMSVQRRQHHSGRGQPNVRGDRRQQPVDVDVQQGVIVVAVARMLGYAALGEALGEMLVLMRRPRR